MAGSAGARSAGGFQPGFVFKIVSPKDRFCVEIEGDSLEPGAKVVTSKARNVLSQKFKTDPIEDAPGEYRVSAVLQPSDGLLVWDWIPGEGLVIHNTASGSPNQIWSTEKVHPGKSDKIFYIKTKDGMCLKHMGKGKQLALVPQDTRDAFQHWRLDPTTSY